MATFSSRLWAITKGVLLYLLFAFIYALISALILTLLVHDMAGTQEATFGSGAIAVGAGAAGAYVADAALRAAFKGSYPRGYILAFMIGMSALDLMLDTMLTRSSILSTSHVRVMGAIASAAYLRFNRASWTRWAVAKSSDRGSTTFGAGIGRMATAGLTAIPMLMFTVMGLVQIAAIYAQVESFARIHGIFAGIVSLFLTYFPLVGSIIGFFGAKDVWGWPWWQAALLYLGFPITILVVSVILSSLQSLEGAAKTAAASRVQGST